MRILVPLSASRWRQAAPLLRGQVYEGFSQTPAPSLTSWQALSRRFLHDKTSSLVVSSSRRHAFHRRGVTPFAPTSRMFVRHYRPDRLYEGQDAARTNEKKFSELSGKLPWEPEMHFLEGVKRSWISPEPTLNELIREDLPLARNLFRNVLQQHYRQDMGMWNKWGCMEWKAGNYDLARMIFAKAAKISFHGELWQSWASMEMEAKNYREARRLYNVILATDPKNANAGLGMALLESEIGQQAKARERFEQLVHDHPEDVLILQAFGVFEARYQHMALARKLFEVATEHANATAQVWHAWAKAEFECGFYKNTLTVLTRGMHRFPTHKWLIQLAAMAHYKLGDVYEARRGFQRLVAGGLYVEPASYNAYAKMEEELGYEEVAIAFYSEALRSNPEHVPSAMALAILFHKQGKVDRARHVFENALDRMQQKHHPVQHTAEMVYAWGSFEEQYAHEYTHAKELYDEVSKQLPSHVDNWKALARIESRLGNINGARTVLNMASQHLPTEAPLLVELAKIEQRNRNFAAARRAYEKALKIDPSRAAVWNMRALLELPLDAERAKNIVESALNVIPKFEKKSWSILMCTYGRAFAALEDYEKAVAAFQNSFKLSPKNWETHVIYAESVLQPNGAWDEAKKHLVAARKLLSRSDKTRAMVEKKLQVVEEQLALLEPAEESGEHVEDDDEAVDTTHHA
ncbi:hypothetical protein Poli38472_006701 [Pythium oligandrum]|uniref:Uncharacterized protein n=1 Tax=Pythium oligandrum TaxID=41045 RepID=A0A8K1C526_PYTOL|nr:hypothetical protein Poli38472_006701 [Pythium oligandrum]|eukprot:TMW56691.1 hypothetical protein Poli38472_006701 [Pythium oligandrum]